MPSYWCDCYYPGFKKVNRKYGLELSEEKIETAAKIMTEYNPRVKYRENEIAPEVIFETATKSWNSNIPTDEIITAFFDGLDLKPSIYDYSFELIDFYKRHGYKTACLTDIPSGMPDALFRETIEALISQIDLYVSSQSCGYRKPNPYGLHYIAKYYKVRVNDLLFTGDEEKDRITAERANCQFISIKDLVSLPK